MRRSFSGWLRITSDKDCLNGMYEDPKKAFQEIEDDEISLKAENKRLRLSFKMKINTSVPIRSLAVPFWLVQTACQSTSVWKSLKFASWKIERWLQRIRKKVRRNKNSKKDDFANNIVTIIEPGDDVIIGKENGLSVRNRTSNDAVLWIWQSITMGVSILRTRHVNNHVIRQKFNSSKINDHSSFFLIFHFYHPFT